MTTESAQLRALLRSDLSRFIHRSFLSLAPGQTYRHNWHIDAIAWHLQQCVEGNITRLIITLPPRHLKSIAVSVAFSAWVLGRDPTRRIISASYSQELALKHAQDTRAILKSDWYQRTFTSTRIGKEKDTQSELVTTRRGFRLATSVGGTLTGRGGSLIIIDDPHKAEEAMSEPMRESVWNWYTNSLVSRLDDKEQGVIVLVQQRLHEDDLAGRLLETGQWTHLNIPSIAEEKERIPIGPKRFHVRKPSQVLHREREPLWALEAIKQEIGSYAFAAQYQQRPASAFGTSWRPLPRKVCG